MFSLTMNIISANACVAGMLGLVVNTMMCCCLLLKDDKITKLKGYLFPIFMVDIFASIFTALVQPGYLADGAFMVIASQGPLMSIFDRDDASYVTSLWAASIVMASTIAWPLFVYHYFRVVKRLALSLLHNTAIALAYVLIYLTFFPFMLRMTPYNHPAESNRIADRIVQQSVNISRPLPIVYGVITEELEFQLLLLGALINHSVAAGVSIYCGVTTVRFITKFGRGNAEVSKKTLRMQRTMAYWMFSQVALPVVFGMIPSTAVVASVLFSTEPLGAKTLIIGIFYAWLPFSKGIFTFSFLRAVRVQFLRAVAEKFGIHLVLENSSVQTNTRSSRSSRFSRPSLPALRTHRVNSTSAVSQQNN